jgi:hypothetical protein
MRGSRPHHQGLQSGVETSKGQRRERKDCRGGNKVRGLGVGKRIRSITTARKSTKDLGSRIEHVQISLDKTKPLLTVQLYPKNQAEPFISLIDSGATANFIHPKIVERLKLPKISLAKPRNI